MNRRLRLPALCTALLFAIPASSCGPDFPFAVFVLPHGPGGNYLAYTQGHIGILQPGYRTRSLVIAFNFLTRHPLTVADQQQAVAVDKQFTDGWQADEAAKQSAPPSGFHTWISTRSALGPIDGYTPTDQLEVNRSTTGDSYEDFTNCLDDAFVSAARTLSALSHTYGRNEPSVVEWARGQDAVFSNCSNGKPVPFYGPGKPPPPPLPPHLPAILPMSTPLWLQQDRAYQLAAAHWQDAFVTWLPNEPDGAVSLKISRAFYETIKDKPVTVVMSLALTMLKSGKATRLILPGKKFEIPGGSICRNTGVWGSDITCLSPMRQPQLMLIATRFTTEDCSTAPPSNDGDLGLGWIGTLDPQPADFGVTSVWESSAWFQRFASARSSQRQHLCPGSPISFVPYTVVSRNQQKLISQSLALKSAAPSGF